MSTLVLQKLSLNNFKTFSDDHKFKLDREAGLYYITGKNKLNPELGANGVGKSTLWDALFWCLFNKTIRSSRPADAIRPWEDVKGSTSVALTLTKLGKTYQIARTRKPNSLTIEHKGKIRDVEQSDVNQLIGISEETFRRSIVLGQFGTAFLDLRPEQQAQMFTEALDLNLWLRAADLAAQRRKETSASISTKQSELDRLQGRLAAVRQQIEHELEQSEAFERNKVAHVNNTAANVEKYAVEIKGILDTVSKTLSEPLRSSLTDTSVSACQTVLREHLASARAEYRALGSDLATSEALVNTLSREKGDQLDRADTYKRAISGNKACPECGQKTSTSHLKEKQAEHETAAAELTKQIQKANNKLNKTNVEVEAKASLLKQIEQLQSQLTIANERWINAREQHKLAQDATDPHDETIAQLKKQRKETKDKLAAAEEAKLALEAQVQSYDFWNTSFKEIRLAIIDEVLRELEMCVTAHMEALGLSDWRIEFQTERTTQSGSVTITFNVLLYPEGQDEPITFESYSGGESQRLQLAATFGLSEVLLERAGISPNIEVYDEPTKGLSAEGVEDLLSHLRERAKSLGRAIFFVDHHSLDRGEFDSIITIVKDAEGAHIQ